ncbi:MAG TPA: MlaD family protein [Thermoanaerobaculaceae bacterium]|nr:MlaD family protein [Thermoanaerobaculaceae bacterium]
MSHTARVGVFMLAALIVLGVFIVKIEEIPIGTHGSRVRFQATFPSVAGLDEKSPVRIAGVRVGIVEAISLQGDRAVATLALDPGVVLHEGARAEVTSLGMLGDKYVELFPGSPDKPPLPHGSTLAGTSPIGFDEALKSFNSAFANIDAVAGSMRATLAGPEGQKRLDEIVENIRQVTAEFRKVVEANRSNVDATLSNVRDFSQTLKTELPRLADKLVAIADHLDELIQENRGNVDASVANVKELTAQLRTTVDNINKITGKIASGEGSIGKLVSNPETTDNLNAALKSGKSAAESIKNTFGRAEGWHLDVNVRAEALPGIQKPASGVNADNSRSAFGIDLQTTPRRFYRLEYVSSPVGRTTTTTDTTTVTLPGGQSQTTTTTTVRTKNVDTFNAQIGYHLGEGFTLRAGLFESTGGVGVDRFLLKDKLRLTFEAYEFNRDVKPPHLRLETRYFLTRNLFAYAGWDDPVWKERSSVLFGGGITWRDEDFKYLLGTAASAAGR